MNLHDGMSGLEMNLIREAARRRVPVSGSLELLPLCNMNCDMCYVRLSPSEAAEQGGIRSREEWLDVAQQMKEAGVLFLLLTGGEPLLYPDFRELYVQLREMGFVLTINTNGTLIDEEWAQFFAQHPPRRINITLYGSCNETYARLCHYPGGYDRVIRGIRSLKERNVAVKIGGSGAVANRSDIQAIIQLGKDLDVPVTVDTYMMPAVRERSRDFDPSSRLSPEEAAELRYQVLMAEMGKERFEEYRQRKIWEMDHILPETGPMRVSCQAGRSSFTVNWQGELRPCVILSTPAVSVFTSGFADAWEQVSAEMHEIRLSEECNACPLRPVCRTCAASALLEAGSYDAVPEYMCRYAGAFARLLRESVDTLS